MFNRIKCWWRRRKHLKYLENQPTAIVVFDGINGPSYKKFNTLVQAMSYASFTLYARNNPCASKIIYIQQGSKRYYRQDIIDRIRANIPESNMWGGIS